MVSNALREDADAWWVDRMYLQDAWDIARKSTDPNTQVGAALVIPSHGVIMRACNSIPERLLSSGYPINEQDKNHCTEHAERKVIYKCLNNGIPTHGMTMYCTWACCSECSRAILEFGISRVVTIRKLVESTSEKWENSVGTGLRMLHDCGIKVVGWSGDLGVDSSLRYNKTLIRGDSL